VDVNVVTYFKAEHKLQVALKHVLRFIIWMKNVNGERYTK